MSLEVLVTKLKVAKDGKNEVLISRDEILKPPGKRNLGKILVSGALMFSRRELATAKGRRGEARQLSAWTWRLMRNAIQDQWGGTPTLRSAINGRMTEYSGGRAVKKGGMYLVGSPQPSMRDVSINGKRVPVSTISSPHYELKKAMLKVDDVYCSSSVKRSDDVNVNAKAEGFEELFDELQSLTSDDYTLDIISVTDREDNPWLFKTSMKKDRDDDKKEKREAKEKDKRIARDSADDDTDLSIGLRLDEDSEEISVSGGTEEDLSMSETRQPGDLVAVAAWTIKREGVRFVVSGHIRRDKGKKDEPPKSVMYIRTIITGHKIFTTLVGSTIRMFEDDDGTAHSATTVAITPDGKVLKNEAWMFGDLWLGSGTSERMWDDNKIIVYAPGLADISPWDKRVESTVLDEDVEQLAHGFVGNMIGYRDAVFQLSERPDNKNTVSWKFAAMRIQLSIEWTRGKHDELGFRNEETGNYEALVARRYIETCSPIRFAIKGFVLVYYAAPAIEDELFERPKRKAWPRRLPPVVGAIPGAVAFVARGQGQTIFDEESDIDLSNIAEHLARFTGDACYFVCLPELTIFVKKGEVYTTSRVRPATFSSRAKHIIQTLDGPRIAPLTNLRMTTMSLDGLSTNYNFLVSHLD